MPDSVEHDSAVATARARRRPLFGALVQRWHRGAGLCAALFLVFLAVSGLLLMHSDRLGLPTAQVENRWIMAWYGIRPPPPPLAFQSDGHWVTQLGPRLYFDQNEIPLSGGVLLGVFGGGAGDELLVITDEQLVLVTPSGEVVERFGRETGLPSGLTAAGRDADGKVVLASAGGRFHFDPELGRFAAADNARVVHWASGGRPPTAVTAGIRAQYSGDGLSLERVLLDLHSGRLFGRLGAIVVNLASLALLFLALSGVFMWARRARRGRRRDGDA